MDIAMMQSYGRFFFFNFRRQTIESWKTKHMDGNWRVILIRTWLQEKRRSHFDLPFYSSSKMNKLQISKCQVLPFKTVSEGYDWVQGHDIESVFGGPCRTTQQLVTLLKPLPKIWIIHKIPSFLDTGLLCRLMSKVLTGTVFLAKRTFPSVIFIDFE